MPREPLPSLIPSARSANGAIASNGNILLSVAVVDRVTIAAICLTVLGWALIWACALSLIEFIPPEVPIGIFVLGLVLIPFRPASRPRSG
jgi:hypothetical protein